MMDLNDGCGAKWNRAAKTLTYDVQLFTSHTVSSELQDCCSVIDLKKNKTG